MLFHQDVRNSATRVSKAPCHHRLISASVVVGAKASGVTKSISKCTLMAPVFEDEVSVVANELQENRGARALNCSATRRKLPADFSRSPLEILGGPQSRFPHPVGSGVLGVDPMPGGKLFQSFDCFRRVFGHRCDLLNSTIWVGVTRRQTVAISAVRRTLLREEPRGTASSG